jgi:O-antigen ligase
VNSKTFNNFSSVIGGILIVSILFLPDIHLKAGWPAFQLVDFLLPIVGITLIVKWTELRMHRYWIVFLLFASYIPITMHLNGRTGIISDYLEIYKLLKFAILILFFALLDYQGFTSKWFKPLFLGIAFVNILHFFNIAGINDLLYDIYGGINLEFFGLDSLKNPATKRMTGLASSPNINAIIFGFFAIHFLPIHFNRKKLYWFIAALFLMLLCQSRTAIVAFAGVLIIWAILGLSNWSIKQWAIVTGSIIALYFIAWAFVTDFFSYQSYSNNVVSNSAMGRIETWIYLFDMIKERPVFGYGVNKQFFYENKLYSENEYILMQWRYGIVGLLLYLTMFLIPLWNYFKRRREDERMGKGLLFLVFIMIIALANNPYQDRTSMLLIAVTLGLIWPFAKRKVQHV